MKKQRVVLVLYTIVVIYSAAMGSAHALQAQSTGVRAISRSNASNSPAEQVRRDANSINCHALGHLETRYGVNWPQSHRYQTVCYHGGLSKGRATRH